MSEIEVLPSDEGRHEVGPEELWSESWYFDFFAPDASVGGWVRLGLYPNLRVAWYNALLVRPGQPTVSVSDLQVALPKGESLEIRAEGLWADHICETALEHWSVANEAHGIAVDDPADLYADAPRGDIVPVAFDLEWETTGSPYHYVYTPRYEVPCKVHGEILVGDERIDFDGWGQRDHSWAPRDWWSFGWVWTAGRLDDGLRFHGSSIRTPAMEVGFGYRQPGDGTVIGTNTTKASEELGRAGLPTAATFQLDDLELAMEPLAFGPAWLTLGDKQDRFPRAMCRFTAADGRTGLGWTEWNQPVE